MDEYRQAVQKLKVTVQQLEHDNNQMRGKLGMPPPQEMRLPQFDIILGKTTSQLYTREQVLKELQKCCLEKGMAIEMLFRCADSQYKNQLTIQEFKEFLDHFFQNKIDPQILQKVALLFDDDCSGIIDKQEFYKVAVYCKVNGEDHPYIHNTSGLKMNQKEEDPANIQVRILQKFITLIREVKNTPQGISQQIDYAGKGFITSDDMTIALNNKGFAPNEIYILMKYFDIKQCNKIKVDDFVFDLKEMLNPNKSAEQLLQLRSNNTGLRILLELKKFRQTLKQHKCDPFAVYYQCQPKDVQRKNISDLAIAFNRYLKSVTFDQIMDWMRLIDTSADGTVDMDEFKMAILVEEDLAMMTQYKSQTSDSQDLSLIDLVMDKMKKKQISLEQFFDWMDVDKNQTVTVIELRKGFIALNIDLSMVLKLLIMFDKNQTGKLDICEFYEAFGSEYAEETDAIIIKKAVQKLNQYFIGSKIDFVTGMKKLLYNFNQSMPIISREEFLMVMDSIKSKCNLMDGEIYKMMEKGDNTLKNQIHLNQFCNYLYNLL